MGKFTFKNGIHPYEGKKISMDKEIEEFFPKGEMVYPLNQHIGKIAKALVKKGDEVLVGQKIAEADGFISANIHSTVSGTVKTIEPRLTPNGDKVISIVIDNDNKFEEINFDNNIKPLNELYREDVKEIIKESGIVGMGGAGFPTNVKLSPKNEDEIDLILVNAAECEPYLTSDYRRLLEDTDKLIIGLKIIINLFDNASGIIAVEDNKPKAIKLLKEKLANEDKIKLQVMETKYPQGGERQLIYANTKRLLNSLKLPADVGCIVQNVDTVISVYEAIIEGKPLMTRVVTITGEAIKEPKNYLVRIGTNIRELIEAAGGFEIEPEKVIAGGPMMGKAMYSLDVPVTKFTSAILCLEKDEVSTSESSNCIRCGKCIEVCPCMVIPCDLARLAENNKLEEFQKNYGMECMDCGCCSYICPAKRHLTQTISSAKRQVIANRNK